MYECAYKKIINCWVLPGRLLAEQHIFIRIMLMLPENHQITLNSPRPIITTTYIKNANKLNVFNNKYKKLFAKIPGQQASKETSHPSFEIRSWNTRNRKWEPNGLASRSVGCNRSLIAAAAHKGDVLCHCVICRNSRPGYEWGNIVGDLAENLLRGSLIVLASSKNLFCHYFSEIYSKI